jgi:hypothetical protein
MHLARAPGTSRKYENGLNRWRKWAISNGLGSRDILPASAFPVALYLTSLSQSANSASPVISAYYSLKWIHDINGVRSPTSSS